MEALERFGCVELTVGDCEVGAALAHALVRALVSRCYDVVNNGIWSKIRADPETHWSSSRLFTAGRLIMGVLILLSQRDAFVYELPLFVVARTRLAQFLTALA